MSSSFYLPYVLCLEVEVVEDTSKGRDHPREPAGTYLSSPKGTHKEGNKNVPLRRRRKDKSKRPWLRHVELFPPFSSRDDKEEFHRPPGAPMGRRPKDKCECGKRAWTFKRSAKGCQGLSSLSRSFPASGPHSQGLSWVPVVGSGFFCCIVTVIGGRQRIYPFLCCLLTITVYNR